MTRLIEIGKLAEELGLRAAELTRELLPAARREGRHYRVGSFAGEVGQSLCITIAGDKHGFWKDFASGEHGDMLDLVAQVLYRGDRREAIRWAKRWLGISEESPAPTRARPPAPQASADPGDREKARRRAAQAIWLEGQADLRGTIADRYLQSRGIDLRALGRQPRVLRFHPSLAYYAPAPDGGRPELLGRWPALLACINDAEGAVLGLHRTWLKTDGSGKAPVPRPKRVLGSYAGGAIRLWRGASGRPLREAEKGERVVITEGIEDGLSVAMASPQHRVLVAISISNMGSMKLPPAIGEVVIMAQNDPEGSQAEQGLWRAIENFHRQGKSVFVARVAKELGKDANDAHRAWLAQQRTEEGAA